KVKRDYVKTEVNEELNVVVADAIYDKVFAIAAKGSEKHERTEAFNAVFAEYKESLSEDELAENGKFLGTAFNKVQKKAVRDCVLKNGTRLDGRATDKIRDIWSEVNYLPSPHGSSVFTRGETQSLTTVTIGTKMDKQRMDAVSESREDQFYLHYNFPPYSTGEAYPIRGTSRREIGHGNLAQRALKGVLPTGEDFPYTVRVVSDILESNGSSSMATVCAGSMALMDAGIQTTGGVSGIAMGLIYDNETKEYAVLSDILGDEDHLGDMDFKVAGTKKGITATQMDIKIDGLSYELLTKALFQSKEGRLHILSEMEKTIVNANPEFKPHAPRIVAVTIPSDFIGAIIGPGGKVIQEMQKETNTVIALEENEGKNTATVTVAGVNKDDIDAAIAKIKSIATVLEVGEVYQGKIKAILAFGAIIEVMPGKEGLLHISEIAHRRVEDVSKEFSEGEIVEVKVLGIDAKSGKIKLSRKALLPKPEKTEQA
ncbi:MAG: polyribonucleotide nucleotidyltransferase, partial [Saprospiraceae bacterium]